jgi:hypothetical protein
MKTIKMKWAISALVFGSAVFFSCKKDKNQEPDCSITMQNLSGNYKLTALKYKVTANAPEVDYFATMDACEKDDIIVLKSNGTYNYNDLGTVCTPSGTGNGTWTLNGNILNSDGTINGTITSFDCKTLSYYAEDINVPEDKYTFTMVRQ